ncbi:hypothetical protein ACH5RR_013072 [Cinchona calisaya]|uniref:Uncharacterized protein n=1 Tax=Cinchona calisaya TaxID=153742 RepID=A0ABD3A2D9_9GENT
MIGEPLKLDIATASLSRPKIDQFCMEIDILKPMLKHFGLGNRTMANGNILTTKMFPNIVLPTANWDRTQKIAYGISRRWIKQALNEMTPPATLAETLFTGLDGCSGNKTLNDTSIMPEHSHIQNALTIQPLHEKEICLQPLHGDEVCNRLMDGIRADQNPMLLKQQ